MSDFLGKIAARAVAQAPALRPRPLSTFEPEPYSAMPPPFLSVERETDQGEPDATRRTDEAVFPAEPLEPEPTRRPSATMRAASMPDTSREKPAGPGSGHQAPRAPEDAAQRPPPDSVAAPLATAPTALPAPPRPRARAAATPELIASSPPPQGPAAAASKPSAVPRADLMPLLPPDAPAPLPPARNLRAVAEFGAQAASSSPPPAKPRHPEPRPPPEAPKLGPPSIAAPRPDTPSAHAGRAPASTSRAPLDEPRAAARSGQAADVLAGRPQRPMRPAAEPVAGSPAIEVHIGRLELHAAPAPPAPQPRPGPSLDAFLHGRRR
jgi:hypothetical protein